MKFLELIGSKLFDEQLLLDFLDHKPEKLEVILIGQGQYEMVFPYDIFLHIDPYTHEAFRTKREYDGVYSHRMVERGNIVDVIEYGEILVDEVYAGYVLDKRDTSLR